MNATCAFLVCALLAACALSLPVEPNAAMEEMDFIDACLFACNLCFDEKETQMMVCANKACMRGEFGLAWMAEHCEGHPHPYVHQFLKMTLKKKH